MNSNAVKSKRENALNVEKAMFPISVVAEILKVHQRTLRIYDEEKILVPSRSPKNRRLYSLNDVERGKFIQYLTRELGINLAGIKIIFTLLEKQNVKPNDHVEFLQKIAESVNITAEIQKENREKLSKRGRKKTVNA